MKERPILFSAPMVRAILGGRKTQTRRIAKEAEHGKSRACRYGAPGDRLWVRETWSKAKSCNASDLFYRADGERQYGRQHALSYVERENRWRPSIHMPRWASRINLEVTGVRVERLQEISTTDAEAEGWPGPDERNSIQSAYPIAWYSCLWESINGAESWAANPWVWIIEFKLVTP